MKPTTIFAIDPGKTGGVAVYRADLRQLAVYDIPLSAGKTGKTQTDNRGLLDLLAPEDGRNIAIVEQVSPRPGEGSVSAFTFGRGFGAIEMACAALGHEVHYVTPSVWKKYFGLIAPKGTAKKLVKDASRALAQNRFPADARHFQRVRDDGRAEAALMALYATEVLL